VLIEPFNATLSLIVMDRIVILQDTMRRASVTSDLRLRRRFDHHAVKRHRNETLAREIFLEQTTLAMMTQNRGNPEIG